MGQSGEMAGPLQVVAVKIVQSCMTLCNPIRWSLLLSSGDFPGKNTAVGYHFLLQRIFLTQGSNLHLLYWQVDSLPPKPPQRPTTGDTCWVTKVVSDSLRPYGLQSSRLLCPWDSPGKNTGVGCHALLQGIFPTQGSNLHFLQLLHCRLILYHWTTGEAPL